MPCNCNRDFHPQLDISSQLAPTSVLKFQNNLCGLYRNRVGIVVMACQATQAGRIDSLESIPGLLKSLKIPAQSYGSLFSGHDHWVQSFVDQHLALEESQGHDKRVSLSQTSTLHCKNHKGMIIELVFSQTSTMHCKNQKGMIIQLLFRRLQQLAQQ